MLLLYIYIYIYVHEISIYCAMCNNLRLRMSFVDAWAYEEHKAASSLIESEI